MTALFVFAIPVTPSFAQAPGHVRVKFVKAGLLVGGRTGSDVLTYRGRNYLFRVSGLSLGVAGERRQTIGFYWVFLSRPEPGKSRRKTFEPKGGGIRHI